MKTLQFLGVLALAFAGCTNTLDDGVPRLYACDRAEGLDSCPSGWRCGLSGSCQDPTQALPYACETSADCSASWHCGPERLCFDRAAATDRSCRATLEATPDAGDCAPGWRCGKETRGEVCHPLDAGAAYLCSSDTDCEATWRCGPEGACVDVATQGLRAGEVTFSAAKVSPLLPNQVDLLQVRLVGGGDVGSFGKNRLVFAVNGTLTVVTNSAELSFPHEASRESTPLLRPGHAMADTEEHLLVSDSSGVVDYSNAFDGGTALLVAGPANAELRYAPPFSSTSGANAQEELAAFSGTTIAICGRGSSSLNACDPTVFPSSTLPSPINDVASVDEYLQRRSVLAATNAGLFFAPRLGSFLALDGGTVSGPVWRRAALTGLSGACSPSPTPINRLFSEPESQLLAVTTDQDRLISVFKRPLTPQNTDECDVLDFDPEYGPCAACGPGEVLLKFGMSVSRVAVCQRGDEDGGSAVVAYRHGSDDGGCSLDPVALPLGVSRGYQMSEQTPGTQGIDSVGVPHRCPLGECETMLSSTAPDRVAGGPGVLALFRDDVDSANGPQSQLGGLSSPLGIRRAQYSTIYVAGSVTENPDWMISSTGRSATQGDQSMSVMPLNRKFNSNEIDPPPYAFFNRSSDLLPSVGGSTGVLIDASGTKAFSTITTDAEGVPWLIVGAGDRIWAADSRLLSEDAGIRTIGIKAVPSPSADIQALVFAPFDRGDAGTGPLLQGYTVEQQRLFRVVVHTPTLWLTDEIRLAETDTVPVSVWMENGRGRVGTTDGRVFGLPVPVAISTSIPEAPLPTVLNYGSLCGQAFALSSSALYRLALETPPLGTWQRVSLESAFAGLDAYGPHWAATIHEARVGNQEHLYLFSQTGLTIELVATCP